MCGAPVLSVPHENPWSGTTPLLHGVSGQENCKFGNAMFGWEECTLQRWQCHTVIVILKVDEQTESQRNHNNDAHQMTIS
jgi:hypothetical protein